MKVGDKVRILNSPNVVDFGVITRIDGYLIYVRTPATEFNFECHDSELHLISEKIYRLLLRDYEHLQRRR